MKVEEQLVLRIRKMANYIPSMLMKSSCPGGAFNTPQLLQLSGIGDSEFLKSKGIEPRVHLPGSG